MPRIAKVVVDLALDRLFDYRIPESLQESARVGCRVDIPFGHSSRRGYIVGFADRSDQPVLKEIVRVVGSDPMLGAGVLRLAQWMSDYYCAPIEKCIQAALPGAVRRRGAKHREQVFVSLSEPMPAEDLEALRRSAPKQAEVAAYLAENGSAYLRDIEARIPGAASAVRALEKKGRVGATRRIMGRNPLSDQVVLPSVPLPLMPQQAIALELIRKAIDTLSPSVVLLHGVTGSGKTEVYLQAIAHCRSLEKDAIVLVPEISLTPQTVERFHSRFGRDIAVLHSALSDGERHDEWHRIREGRARIVIGARSAVFAPLARLGLIVVDEEHENSYKQDEVPRYSARDVAVMRGRIEGCAVVLGSATPSLESWRNAQIGKYALATLPHRVDHRCMPRVRVLDMRQELDERGRPSVFSRELIEAMRCRLERAEQTILFLNRRGYATSLLCPKCGYVARCDACSVAFTYHRHTEALVCHICGQVRRIPLQCPECRDPQFRYAGIGTQRVETIVQKIFPRARVHRMDADATTRKDSHRRILGEFRSGRIDILIGTQMVAKGLDFPNVTLIGVIHADMSLHMPDFRASERTFQLLTQVAGRAGRGDIPGEVIVQTYTPGHPAVEAAQAQEFERFFEYELKSRHDLKYPPFSHLVCLTIRGRSEERVAFASNILARTLRPRLPASVVLAGPVPAPLAKAQGFYRYQILMRAPATRQMTEPLKRVLADFRWPGELTCVVDVDALSIM